MFKKQKRRSEKVQWRTTNVDGRKSFTLIVTHLERIKYDTRNIRTKHYARHHYQRIWKRWFRRFESNLALFDQAMLVFSELPSELHSDREYWNLLVTSPILTFFVNAHVARFQYVEITNIRTLCYDCGLVISIYKKRPYFVGRLHGLLLQSISEGIHSYIRRLLTVEID